GCEGGGAVGVGGGRVGSGLGDDEAGELAVAVAGGHAGRVGGDEADGGGDELAPLVGGFLVGASGLVLEDAVGGGGVGDEGVADGSEGGDRSAVAFVSEPGYAQRRVPSGAVGVPVLECGDGVVECA